MSRAPVRVCDLGGWTDTWFTGKGIVFNACVDLYSHVSIVESIPGTGKVDIHSADLGSSTSMKHGSPFKRDGCLDLLKATVKLSGALRFDHDLSITAWADAPPACGTGTSASISVAMMGALSVLNEDDLDPLRIANLPHRAETIELGLQSGVQDQYAAASAGLNLIEVNYPRAFVTPVHVDPEIWWQLEQQLVLLYVGSRSSSAMHDAVIRNYQAGHVQTIEAFETLNQCPREFVRALEAGDFSLAGEAMDKNWEAQKMLHARVTTPRIESAHKAVRDLCLGFKVNGAGGGGSISILARPKRQLEVRRELAARGFTLLPCKLTKLGVHAWVARN